MNQSHDLEVLIAVLDSAIDKTHEDLAGKVVSSINLTDSLTASDRLGHGTHVAGIIVAKINSENIRLLNVKIADDNGMVWPSVLAKGIIWAVDNGGTNHQVQFINNNCVEYTLEEAVDYASRWGVVIIVAAGNSASSTAMYPALYPDVIAVAAINKDGNVWSQSSNGDWVDVYAPGVEIFSILPGNSYGYK